MLYEVITYGIQKAQSIGINQKEFEAPDKERLEQLKGVFEKAKIKIVR